MAKSHAIRCIKVVATSAAYFYVHGRAPVVYTTFHLTVTLEFGLNIDLASVRGLKVTQCRSAIHSPGAKVHS